jgi:hypothetical protein
MSRFLLALALLLGALVPSAGQAKRVALIIGMSDYQHLSSLINPVPDARAIAAELKSHGFEVSEYYNLDRADLLDALEKFKREATGTEVVRLLDAAPSHCFAATSSPAWRYASPACHAALLASSPESNCDASAK